MSGGEGGVSGRVSGRPNIPSEGRLRMVMAPDPYPGTPWYR